MNMLILNPGAGHISGLRLSMHSATSNLRSFLTCMPAGTTVSKHDVALDDSGRLCVTLTNGTHTCNAAIPGCAMRWLASPAGFPPRLYVDDNSWLWRFAVKVANDCLSGLSQDEP